MVVAACAVLPPLLAYLFTTRNERDQVTCRDKYKKYSFQHYPFTEKSFLFQLKVSITLPLVIFITAANEFEISLK